MWWFCIADRRIKPGDSIVSYHSEEARFDKVIAPPRGKSLGKIQVVIANLPYQVKPSEFRGCLQVRYRTGLNLLNRVEATWQTE